MHPVLVGTLIWLAMGTLIVLAARLLLPHRRSAVICPKSNRPAVLDLDGHLTVEACSSQIDGCKYDCLLQAKLPAEPVEASLAHRTPDCGPEAEGD